MEDVNDSLRGVNDDRVASRPGNPKHAQRRHTQQLKSQQSTCTPTSSRRPSKRQPLLRRSIQNLASLPSALLLLISTINTPTATAQSCISLAGSSICPAFNQSQISTSSSVAQLLKCTGPSSLARAFPRGFLGTICPGPFLTNVTNTSSFDDQVRSYVAGSYTQQKFTSQGQFGCSNVDVANSTNLYARYTYSFICNSIIQNSLQPCGLQSAAPLCADSCSSFALSEQRLVSSPDICGTSGPNALDQLRADLTHCQEPSGAISGTCVEGYQNEPDNCGFQNNIDDGLCTYCNTSSINATDSCCETSNAESRCQNVRLPTFTSMAPLVTSTSSSSTPPATSTAAPVASSGGSGLSGGQIAGIVVGSVIGGLLLLGLLTCCCMMLRKRRNATAGSRSSGTGGALPLTQGDAAAAGMSGSSHEKDGQFAPIPGSRVTRMAALEGEENYDDTPPNAAYDGHGSSGNESQTQSTPEYTKRQRPYAATAIQRAGDPPKRDKSRSDYDPTTSPSLAASPQGVAGYGAAGDGSGNGNGRGNGQSEQLAAFRDYYSTSLIHPGDAVSTLWAYQPRAADEFDLERGDVLRIVGIWDDGWATGVRLRGTADEWAERVGGESQRDSVVSEDLDSEGEGEGEGGRVKAFPLVCVCDPGIWRKVIEGDTELGATTTTTGTDGDIEDDDEDERDERESEA